MHNKEIFVLIINYKSADLTKNAIASINEKEFIPIVYILDNESTEDSYNRLKKIEYPNIFIIRSDKNLGFSSGVNYAYKQINKDKKFPYMFLLNPDALCTKNLIFNLYRILKNDNQIAAVSPKIIDFNGDTWYLGGKIDYNKCIVENYSNEPIESGLLASDFLNGAVALIDTKKFEHANMFNPNLFLYCDEIFISKKYHELGYKIVCDTNSLAHHSVSGIVGKESVLKSYYSTRNNLFFFKNSKRIFQPFVLPIKNSLWYLRKLKLKNFFYIFLGILHFLTNKQGKL